MVKTITLPFTVRKAILACGADLKGAFALAKGRKAVLAGGFGDLGDPDNFERYETAIASCERKLKIKPKIVACDLHPDYFSTRYAENYTLSAKRYTLYNVQHHEAHIASAIIDNSIKGDIIGAAFDGTGFGSDGKIWGGEFFVGGLRYFKRAAHLEYIPMPGGEMAVKEPWRMAASYLYRAYGDRFLKFKLDYMSEFDLKDWSILKEMIRKNINSPLTSSIGRFFDAAGSLILARPKVNEEAQLPVELERIAGPSCLESYEFDLKSEKGTLIVKPLSIIQGVVKDLSRGMGAGMISGKFHNAVSDIIARVIVRLSRKTGIKKTVLSGGVFQNRTLRDRVIGTLEKKDFRVYLNSYIPTNDSGIPIGQLAIANSRLICA